MNQPMSQEGRCNAVTIKKNRKAAMARAPITRRVLTKRDWFTLSPPS